MNKYEHAEQSAKIFGGNAKDYLPIHEVIDSNKVVSSSIFGRFFMHHYDLGLPILQKIFGATIKGTDTTVEDVLIQHLIEDYEDVPTFTGYWLPNLEAGNKNLPKVNSERNFLRRISENPRTKELTATQINEIDSFFRLETFTTEKDILNSSAAFAIFGHALGADLAVRILGEKFHGYWTSDIVVGYLGSRFDWDDKQRLPTPSLLDYEAAITRRSWMFAPNREEKSRLGIAEIQKKIQDFKDGGRISKIEKDKFTSELSETFFLDDFCDCDRYLD